MITESQILTVLRTFLLGILPAGIEIVRGLDNRVAEPIGANFITMTPILRERLAQNTDTYVDIEVLTFATLTVPTVGAILTDATTGGTATVISVSGLTVTIGTITAGYFNVGDTVTGVGVIMAVSYGTKAALQPTKITIQLDIHGPVSADNAQIVSTLLRDGYAYDQMIASGYTVTPLYASEPNQLPFFNGEQQVEERWIIDAVLQADIVIYTPLQFADTLALAGIHPIM